MFSEYETRLDQVTFLKAPCEHGTRQLPNCETEVFYILFIHQQLHFILNLESLKFTLEYT